MAVYYATKAYVISFSEALADELAATGVTVSCLCPGPTVTEFAETAKMGDALLFRLQTMTAQAGRPDRLPRLSPRQAAGRAGLDQLPGQHGRPLGSPQRGPGNRPAVAMELNSHVHFFSGAGGASFFSGAGTSFLSAAGGVSFFSGTGVVSFFSGAGVASFFSGGGGASFFNCSSVAAGLAGNESGPPCSWS